MNTKWLVALRSFSALSLVAVAAVSIAWAETVPIDVPTRNKAAYVANAQDIVRTRPEILAEMVFITAALQKSPEPNAGAIRDILVAAKNNWESQRAASYADAFTDEVRMFGAIADVLGDAGGTLGVSAKVLSVAYGGVLSPRFEKYLEQQHQAADRTLAGEWWLTARSERGRKIVEDFYDSCRKSGGNAHICDTIMGSSIEASVADSSAQICGNKPNLGGCNFLQQDTIDINQALGELQKQLATMNGVTKETLETLQYIGKTLGQDTQTLVAWVKSQQASQAEQKAAEVRALHEAKIQIAQGTVSIISSLVGLGNPKLGQQIAVTGNAAIQIADSVSKFMKSAATINRVAGGIQKLQNVASAVLSIANVVGAGLQIMSLFQPGEPSLDAMILEEIWKIGQQIEQLRTEMHGRFDRIDATLNTIYETLTVNFAAIDYNLGKLNGNVADIQKSLLGLEADLNRIQRNLYSFLDTGFRQDLLLEINGSLGYRERTGSPLPFEPQFVNAENTFQTWVTIFASDPLRAGPLQREYTDGAILTELNNLPLASNINYLSQYPSQVLGHPALSSGRLANPMDLAFSAHAWLQLTKENPAHATRIAPYRLEEIQSTALKLNDALAKIPNKALFTALLQDYRNQIGHFDDAMKHALATYQNTSGLRIAGLDLWGGANQSINYIPPISEVLSTQVTLGISPPTNWVQLFGIPKPFLIADYLGENIKLYVTDSPRWVDVSAPGPLCLQTASLEFTITVLYQGRIIRARKLRSQKTLITQSVTLPYCSNVVFRDPYAALKVGWTGSWGLPPNPSPNLKAQFETDSQAVSSGDDEVQSLQNATTYVEQALRKHQLAFYLQMKDALTTSSGLQEAARRPSGKKLAIESFIALGLPMSMAHNDFLRALLFGPERLPDAELIASLYTDAHTKLEAGQPAPKIDMAAIAKERADALEEVLMTTLDRIAAGEIKEGHPFLEALQLQLSLTAKSFSVPDQFTFTDQTGAGLNTVVVSHAIIVSGINTSVAISVIGGAYSINGGAFTATDGTVANGASVRVRHKSANAYATATNTTLTIGGVTDTFTATTLSQPPVVSMFNNTSQPFADGTPHLLNLDGKGTSLKVSVPTARGLAILFEAKCSVAARDDTTFIDIEVLVDGIAVPPSNVPDNALCTSTGDGALHHWVRAGVNVARNVGAGTHTIQVRGTLRGFVAGEQWQVDDTSVVVIGVVP
jgi:hypothetical protein